MIAPVANHMIAGCATARCVDVLGHGGDARSHIMSLFEDLKRRNVVRVSIAYVVASWLLVQVGDIARESFEAPTWVMKMLITALIAGFPIVVFFS